jgi:hypothetical protein
MRTPPLLLAVLSLALSSAVCAAERPRGVVELFTSQGCSSCPAADLVLGELAGDPSLIVMSMPVDYWDYIGWKDTLASPECTKRQKGYAAARGDGQVYTPQAVIDGLVHVVGANRDDIVSAVASKALAKGALTLDVAINAAGGRLSVDVGAGAAQPASVVLLEIEPQATVAVGRGENEGRTLTYTNVVRKMTRLGEWNGAAAHFEATASQTPGHAYVAMVQAGAPDRPGVILGAARGF